MISNWYILKNLDRILFINSVQAILLKIFENFENFWKFDPKTHKIHFLFHF